MFRLVNLFGALIHVLHGSLSHNSSVSDFYLMGNSKTTHMNIIRTGKRPAILGGVVKVHFDLP